MKVVHHLSRKRKVNFQSDSYSLSNAKTDLARPVGYFANCYSKEEIREQNWLAKASVVHAPADFE